MSLRRTLFFASIFFFFFGHKICWTWVIVWYNDVNPESIQDLFLGPKTWKREANIKAKAAWQLLILSVLTNCSSTFALTFYLNRGVEWFVYHPIFADKHGTLLTRWFRLLFWVIQSSSLVVMLICSLQEWYADHGFTRLYKLEIVISISSLNSIALLILSGV